MVDASSYRIRPEIYLFILFYCRANLIFFFFFILEDLRCFWPLRVDELLVFLHLWCKYCRLAANLNFDYKSLLCSHGS